LRALDPAGRLRLAASLSASLSSRRSAGSPVVAFRLFSSSTRWRLAEPHPDAHNVQPLSPPLGSGILGTEDKPDKNVDPHKYGPSAIDKAVHLFFFTEILRGMLRT
jgi:hypothetical protein